jgi:alkylhydroperoxidase/carboxymuconolactone decarboxylase family protein YurZ
VQDHFAGAKKAGASDDEIRETMAMAMMAAGGKVRVFLTETIEGLELKRK